MANTPLSGSSNAAIYNDSQSGPEILVPTPTQGGAPAGRFFSEAELPIRSVDSGSGFKEGFSPSDNQSFTPIPGSDHGSPLPPSNGRK